jgi:hypothetical protein
MSSTWPKRRARQCWVGHPHPAELLVPLALANGASSPSCAIGTHVEWSPPFDVWRALFSDIAADGLWYRRTERWGWYPVGQGEVVCGIACQSAKVARWDQAVELLSRPLAADRRSRGRQLLLTSATHGGPGASLGELGVPVDIEAQLVTAACPGASIFLVAEYKELAASFSAHARLGKPAEAVADDAVAAILNIMPPMPPLSFTSPTLLLRWRDRRATIHGASTERPSLDECLTIGQFGVADISIGQETPALCASSHGVGVKARAGIRD